MSQDGTRSFIYKHIILNTFCCLDLDLFIGSEHIEKHVVSRSSRMSQDSASSVCFREEPELQLGVLTAGCSSHEANLRPCIAFTFAKVEHTNNTFLDQCCIQTTNAMRQNNNVILQKKQTSDIFKLLLFWHHLVCGRICWSFLQVMPRWDSHAGLYHVKTETPKLNCQHRPLCWDPGE